MPQVRSSQQNGKAESSLLSELLGDLDAMGEIDEECVKGVCSTMFVAGADTVRPVFILIIHCFR